MAVCCDWSDVERSSGGPVPKVAVAVLVCRRERVLMCRRKCRTCRDEIALPGGFLEFGETLEECACRELTEEAGMELQNVKFGAVTNTILMDDLRPVHYVTVYLRAEPKILEQEPDTLEPHMCADWMWVNWPNVPRPIFKPLQELLNQNYDPFALAYKGAEDSEY